MPLLAIHDHIGVAEFQLWLDVMHCFFLSYISHIFNQASLELEYLASFETLLLIEGLQVSGSKSSLVLSFVTNSFHGLKWSSPAMIITISFLMSVEQ